MQTLWLTAALCAGLGCAAGPGQAGALRLCERQAPLSATQQDKLFRFGAIVKAALEDSGQSLALVARSGLDLSRFGVRYSHAGVSLKASPNTPWSVRQLYYACDAQQPKIYDEGLSGFLLGTDDPAIGYLAAVFLPPAAAGELERAALDNRQAVQLLGAAYSANAYAFSVRYQNCNQWLAELLATTLGSLQADSSTADLRAQAQQWLKGEGYVPTVFNVGWRPLMWLGNAIPWLHADDHPAEDIAQALYRVSMPASIEAFVQASVPGATRMEFCHTERHVVVRRGWVPIADGCQPGEHDTVIALDD